MANKTVECSLPTGLTGCLLKLFDRGGDTLLNTGGDTLTERTNAKGKYTATVTEALAGFYTAIVYLSDGTTPLDFGQVYLVDAVGTYYMVPEAAAGTTGGAVTYGTGTGQISATSGAVASDAPSAAQNATAVAAAILEDPANKIVTDEDGRVTPDSLYERRPL